MAHDKNTTTPRAHTRLDGLLKNDRRPHPTQGLAIALVAIVPILIIALAIMTAVSASARSKCHKGFQDVAGSNIATPRCQDIYLAQVAQEYGSRYSARTIMNNPNAKKDACRLVGNDIRIQEHCRGTATRFRGQ